MGGLGGAAVGTLGVVGTKALAKASTSLDSKVLEGLGMGKYGETLASQELSLTYI